jgi:glycosyltransferase involved in cell wall biosynthesis
MNASAYETFCRAAHEAAVSGLPVVVPPLSGIRDLVGDGEAGVCVRTDAEGTGVALRLPSDARLREQLGAEASARARALGPTRVAREVVALRGALARQVSSPESS